MGTWILRCRRLLSSCADLRSCVAPALRAPPPAPPPPAAALLVDRGLGMREGAAAAAALADLVVVLVLARLCLAVAMISAAVW